MAAGSAERRSEIYWFYPTERSSNNIISIDGSYKCIVNYFYLTKYLDNRSQMILSHIFFGQSISICRSPRPFADQPIFQSSLPSWGATRDALISNIQTEVFQSPLPSRGATTWTTIPPRGLSFQSPLPSRGATDKVTAAESSKDISIPAPLTGSDIQFF